MFSSSNTYQEKI